MENLTPEQQKLINFLQKAEVHQALPILDALEEINSTLKEIADKELSTPEVHMPEVQKVVIEGVDALTIKGDKGDKGDTPVKGVDYFDGEDGETVVGPPGPPGPPGKKGETVVGPPGKDADEESIIAKLQEELPNLGVTFRDALEKLAEGEKLHPSAIEGLEEKLTEVAGKEVKIQGSVGGGKGVYLYVGGTKKGLTKEVNLKAGSNMTLTYSTVNGLPTVTFASSGGGGSGHTVQDEGVALTARTNLNFVGAGVTATDDAANDATKVTIPGGSGLTIGTTGITSGTDTKVLFDNAGTLGEYTVSGTGSVAMTASPALTGSPTAPTASQNDNSTKLATTAYVDLAVLGQNFKEAVKVATTANLVGTYLNGSSGVGATFTYTATGVDAVDGVNLALGNRILLKNQTTDFQNGIYTVTTAGAIGVAGILTRATDANQTTEFKTGDSVFVTAGTTQTSTTWAYTGIDSPTMGTTSLTYVQVAGQGSFTGGNGITITGTSIAIDTSVTVDKTTAQILTNKTINGANNTLTVRLANDVTGNLPVTNLNSGTSASSSTFWRGDGSWAALPSTITPFAETPSGTVNGSNVTFTLANTPGNASGVIVLLDGVVQYNGSDFTMSGATITFVTAPATGSTIFAYYNTLTSGGTITIGSTAISLGGTSTTLAGLTSVTSTTFVGNLTGFVAPRTNTVASSATPSINTDTTDDFTITALAVAITSMTTNLTGTPVNGQKLTIRFLDNGSARAITWGASFASRGATLPTTTILSKYLYVGLKYNSTAAVWDCVATSQET